MKGVLLSILAVLVGAVSLYTFLAENNPIITFVIVVIALAIGGASLKYDKV